MPLSIPSHGDRARRKRAECGGTTLGGASLYPDIAGAIQRVRNLGNHPYEFYLRVGFTIAGVLPYANGTGTPDIFLAKPVAGSAAAASR